MGHTQDPAIREELVRGLKRAEGHVRAVRGMVERQEPCEKVLEQVTAVQGVLNAVAGRLLEDHLESVLVDDSVDQRIGSLPELRQAIKHLLR